MGSQVPKICYGRPMEGTKGQGHSHIYRNPQFPELGSTPDPKFQTLRDIVLDRCLSTYPNKLCVGRIQKKQQKDSREIVSMTYGQVFQKIQKLGKKIISRGLEYKVTDVPNVKLRMIGIYAKNRQEWLLADLSCILYGLTLIPLYDTLGVQNLTYCLKETFITTLYLTSETVKSFIKLKDIANIKNVILFDRLTPDIVKQLESRMIKIYYYQDLLNEEETQAQKQIKYDQFPIEPNDNHTFSYTSGTTGPPKGAMLSHRNFTSFLFGFQNHQAKFTAKDSYLSFLPLPHVFERVVICACFYSGCHVTFYAGDILKLKDDCQLVRPTVFVAVPRLYNKIVESIQKQVSQSSSMSQCMFQSGVSSKIQQMSQSGDYSNLFYDSIVFSKVREKFGGRIRIMISGSAPLSAKTHSFMKLLMCCPLYEGYGQTENTAAAFVQATRDHQLGHCGGVVSNLQFMLVDIPEMHYTSDDKNEKGESTPRGQIWLRGPGVFQGYYKNQQKTKQAITKEGWLKTGDVGMLTPNSLALKIIDRKKNIFKLQQGQYIASQKIENIYVKNDFVNECFIYGDSTQNFIVAIIMGNDKHLLKLAQSHNIKGSFQQIVLNQKLKLQVCKQLSSLGKKQGLNSLEIAKNIYIDTTTFQLRELVSSTLKLQRFEAKKYYQKEIQAMYKQGQLPLK